MAETKYTWFDYAKFLIGLTGMIILYNLPEPDRVKYMKELLEKDSLEAFHGKVDSLYINPNHNIPTAILSNKYEYQIDVLWQNDIEVGDSLVKKLGSFNVEVFKKDKSKTILNYKEAQLHPGQNTNGVHKVLSK